MTATTTKAIAAHLTFNVEVRLSVSATKAEWKKLTEDYLDPEESWARHALDVIYRFVDQQIGYQASDELTDRVTVDFPEDAICGLTATEPEIECVDFNECEIEVISKES